ncbi:SNF2 family DNA-dependent ATPase domain-containing protein [Delphinella strobiligena]|nr:SNF2 family DNA-dependent ATPase domain-containing protein [Delphinella strobiligena]
MSVMNILSDAPVHAPPPPAPASPEKSARDPPAPAPASVSHQDIKIESTPTDSERDRRLKQERSGEPVQASAAAPPVYPVPPPQLPTTSGPPGLTVKATEEAYAAILEKADTSDLEEPGMEGMKVQWHQRSAKRAAETEAREGDKRKRRRATLSKKYLDIFVANANLARDQFVSAHEKQAEEEVRIKDVEDEKERKKDMQRKRRRERTIQNETQKRDEAIEKLKDMNDDDEERMKLLKDVQKLGKKIRNTEDLLRGRTPIKDLRGDSPGGPNLEGGIMSSFQANNDLDADSKTKKAAKGYRPRKSKQQKQAEKDNAAAGQAYLDRGDELPAIAPKEELRLKSLMPTRDSSEAFDDDVSVDDIPPGEKGLDQVYREVWKEISSSVAKIARSRANALDIKHGNMRKTSQLASKEARRWQLRTNKSTKDVQARAKRSMREMLSFWKRNERDERDQRKIAERQELENAKKAEADREANRQKRKLNFLISQTELYSHFIGKKVKTDEVEKSTDDADASSQLIRPAAPNAHTVDLPDTVGDLAIKVTNFEDLDFDAEDETALRQAAMANAQNAVKEAQDRARAFNNDPNAEPNAMSQFDDGEMNFQNPTSLQSMDISQPNMLTCQLKEYQLKGLNWLVNLYEQGINGILADEMGLGKTVQSISVMAYLAEVHNIWGPFLVIAPASTLHNWQQEIAKFVPTLKVLPYWGNAKDRKVLRKFWDRKHITYNRDSSFHVLVTSYQLVVQDTPYFQKIRWQYMILDEAQAIKSSQSSRWKALLGFHCRNRLLLTGTPIQNNMQELWALLHFIMPSLFDSHDEFSDWFSKDIESHAQSNTKLNEDQLKRLHMILKPFMLRRVKKHVQKELGDKIEEDVFCDLTYRQRAYYANLRNKISIMDLIERAAVGDDQDTATLMNLVMQFRKVCNHPDLFERAEITSPLSMSFWAETASFSREGHNVQLAYSVRNLIEYWLPKKLGSGDGRLDLPGPDNPSVGWKNRWVQHMMNIWDPEYIRESETANGAFAWLRFIDSSASRVSRSARDGMFDRAVTLRSETAERPSYEPGVHMAVSDRFTPVHAMFNIANTQPIVSDISDEGYLYNLLNISKKSLENSGFGVLEPCALPSAHAPPIELVCPSQKALSERESTLFNTRMRTILNPVPLETQSALLYNKVPPSSWPITGMLPPPASEKQRYTKIEVPSMRRFVTDSGKLAKLDQLLKQLKESGHRVLLYFQMTRMIDLMEEYLTYRNYKYCRLDGSTKLEDRRDTVAAFQSSPDIFVFLLSTRAGGLGINLTSADTVIFYDSDWNPTIDSQAMDRAHRLGQTRQVTVYRLITRGTIEERIRKRALQKEEVQRVVISGGAAGGDKTVDFNARSRENRTKDIALWLADDDQAAAIERKEAEMAEQEAKEPNKTKKKKAPKKKEVSMDALYHEGEGQFDDDNSNKPSGAATPVPAAAVDGTPAKGKKKGTSKKAKTLKQRLAVVDGEV